MSPADIVLEFLANAVTWLSNWLPRIPSPWLSFVNNGVTSAAQLVQGVPYTNIVPWSVLASVATGLPAVLGAAYAARMIMRVWAWIRSRGAADQ